MWQAPQIHPCPHGGLKRGQELLLTSLAPGYSKALWAICSFWVVERHRIAEQELHILDSSGRGSLWNRDPACFVPTLQLGKVSAPECAFAEPDPAQKLHFSLSLCQARARQA